MKLVTGVLNVEIFSKICPIVTKETHLYLVQYSYAMKYKEYSRELEQKIKDQINDIVRLSSLNKAIVNNVGMALITTDKKGIIRTFNNEAGKLTGYDPEEVMGKRSVLKLFKAYELEERSIYAKKDAASDIEADYETIRKLAEYSEGKSEEWSFLRNNAEEIPVVLSVTTISDSKGDATGFILSAMDISRRKELETSLRESLKKEKELNQMKSRFVSTASHELRTPLATLLLTSESLLNHREKLSGERQEEKLRKIHQQLKHLSKIVDNILELSKIESGKIEFNPEETDLLRLCDQVLDKYNEMEEVQGKILFSAPERKIILNLDRTLIASALDNLLSNAVKYSGGKPGIKLEVTEADNKISILVSDRGIGIPEEDRQHIFLPFFRSSNTALINGNGLGLSIVKESVRLHGGEISFSSEVDKGTTFRLDLPATMKK
ncbi:MAG: PAS domain-containing sensor histidine kinase [Bacteroidota bacterium]